MDAQLNFNTNKLIIVCYPRFAGGKFLINCLALSKYATFQDNYLVKEDLNSKNLDKEPYYNFKLKTALNSLPSKNDMNRWGNYEYGCVQLFNWASGSFCEEELSNEIVKDEVKLLSNQEEINFFIVAHDNISLKRVLNHFPNSKILLLTDFVDFMINARLLKDDPTVINLKNYKSNWTDDKYFEYIDSFSEYKIDYTMSYADIFEEDKFLKRIEDLYDDLGYDDFNRDLVSKFYQAYISLHV